MTIQRNKNDLGKAFNDLLSYMYRDYRGGRCEKVGRDWTYAPFRLKKSSWEELTRAIDQRQDELNQQTKIVKNETV